jgi:hypothetical protein
MPWNAPGVGDSGWLGVALIVGWFGLLLTVGMVIRLLSERKHKK